MIALRLLTLAYAVVATLAGHQPGRCSIYGNCGKKLFFGAQLPCPVDQEAVAPSPESAQLLQKICGADFPTDRVCCSYEQLVSLELNLKRVDPLISSCPACRHNFYDFFCKFTCSPDQAQFVEVTKTGTAIDTHEDIVTELSQFVDPEYASAFFDSCKNIKFSATNGYAMDLIGGGAKNYLQFLKFLGDEKPLLGGSPFQINFSYKVTKDQKDEGLVLRHGNAKPCDDPNLKCACSDCPSSCPALEAVKYGHCTVLGLPCFSFGVIIVWALLIGALGAFHVHLARKKRARALLVTDAVSESSQTSVVSASPLVKRITAGQVKLIRLIEDLFLQVGFFCATYPGIIIGACLGGCLLLSSGLLHVSLETDPVNLWVSPNEPALKNKQYFEENFGEWFRIEQIIVSNKTGPVLSWDTVQWWFEKELELQSLEYENETLHLDDFCFKPLGETCAIESFAQYFEGNINYLTQDTWQSRLKSCTDSPVNCLPTFQQPLKKELLFSSDAVFTSEAFIVTLLLNKNLSDTAYTARTERYERALQSWLFDLKEASPHLHIDFSTELSLEQELNKSTNTDVSIVVVSYLMMFVYASVALGGKVPKSLQLKNFVHTRFQLGLGGIVIILLSVFTSAGFFSFLGVKLTLIIAEVIPFLVLAIGVDNIFLIVHELHLVNESVDVASTPLEERIALAVGNIGPSCLISAILQFSLFLLATRVDMPAVKNFAYYSAGAILFNFVLQMTGFVAFLALDQRRLEEGRVDCAPWIRVPITLDESEHVEYDFSSWIGNVYAPWLLKPSNKRKVLTAFVLWLGFSLSLLPGIKYGLDQRIALPQGSYLIDYFNSVYEYLNVGPPVFFVVKDLDVTKRDNQQKLCGRFSTCEEFSVVNILEQEYKRPNVSLIAEPASNWLDDFLGWLNPDLDQCCRFKKSTPGHSPLEREFCSATAPERQCETCFADHEPPYSSFMDGFPENKEFMAYFHHWINEPSDPCPLGGRAPYSTSISATKDKITASYFRTSHRPLRSQDDFIFAYRNLLRVVDEIQNHQDIDMFAFSPFYVFFVQYQTILLLTLTLLGVASVIVWLVSAWFLVLVRAASVLTVTVAMVLVNIGGVLLLWRISLNAVSLVNLVICMGLAVEFCIHLTRAYVKPTSENVDSLFDGFFGKDQSFITDNQSLRAYNALVSVGGSVLGGITITKFIGISVLAFTRSKIFEVYYFRMWLALVAIAAVHALVFLPVLLSYFGGGSAIEAEEPSE